MGLLNIFKGKLGLKILGPTVLILGIEMVFLMVLTLEMKDNLIRLIFIATAGTIILAIVLQILLRKIVVNPIERLTDAMKRISGGDLNPVSINSDDEIGELTNAINESILYMENMIRGINNVSLQIEGLGSLIVEDSKRWKDCQYQQKKPHPLYSKLRPLLMKWPIQLWNYPPLLIVHLPL